MNHSIVINHQDPNFPVFIGMIKKEFLQAQVKEINEYLIRTAKGELEISKSDLFDLQESKTECQQQIKILDKQIYPNLN